MRGKEWCWRRSWRADPHERDATVEQEKSVRSPPLRRKERQRQCGMKCPQAPFAVALGRCGEEVEVW